MIRKKITLTVAFFAAVFLSILFTGCTERERRGLSSIPQNSPASWELTPYGNAQN